MRPRHGGLGRGLDALIPIQGASAAPDADPRVEAGLPQHEGPEAGQASHSGAAGTEPDGASANGYRVLEIPLDSLRPNPRQPRTEFDEEELHSLAASIREVGVLQPVVVRAVGDGGYELVMGERRLRASRLADRSTIPALIRDTHDEDLLRDALLENLHRADLNALEEAAAYQSLLGDLGLTHDQLGQRLGISRAHVTNTIRLLSLPPMVQRRVAAGVLSAGHARALLGLSTPEEMAEVAARVVAEGLSVRATEEIVALAAGGKQRRRPTRPPVPGAGTVELDSVADRLASRFDTRVQVQMSRRKGRIVVEFASVDDLDRIVGLMALGEGSGAGPLPESREEALHPDS